MAGDPDVISFIESLQKGSSVYYVEFPELFLEAPSVITELNNDLTSAIVPYIVSGVSNSGFYVNFGSALSFDGYELSVNAEVTGVRDIDSDVSSLAFKDLSLDDDVSSLAASPALDTSEISSLSKAVEDLSNLVASIGLENPVSYNGTDLGVLATKIYDEELGFHTGQERTTEIGLISNWLEGHLGELNTLIFTSFSGYNPENFNLEEQAILREMYLAEYNRKAHRNVLRGIVGTDSSSDFQVIREGDSMIQKPNKNIAAKSLYDSYQSSQNKVKDLVYAYNLYGAKPSQVVGGDAPTTGSNPSLDGYYR